jgi:DNA mismatch repair protein MSH4
MCAYLYVSEHVCALQVSGLREKLQVSALKIKYTPQRMYHIVMPRVWYEGNHEKLKDPDREEAPLFIDVVVKRKTVACTTSHLASLNARQDEAYCDIVTITERIIQSLLQTIRSNIMWLFQVSESIGFLDLMLCFANLVVLNPDYCMPQLTTEGPIAIKGGRHPIIENTRIASGSSLRFVPNDCFLTVESGHRLHIISGPNGAGKSVYIKVRRHTHLTCISRYGNLFFDTVYE